MQSKATKVDDYIKELPEERKAAVSRLRKIMQDNLGPGIKETMSYGMIGFVVPHEVYPDGYHCDPKLPLPFINIASQKNFVAVYHMGMYANKELLDWFVAEYPKHVKTKLDMGKSCVRFKKMENIPYDLITELAKKMGSEEWIKLYDKNVKN